MDEPLGLGYWLPRTEFVLRASLERRVVTSELGSSLEPHVSVSVVPSVQPDRERRQALHIHEGMLENVSVEVDLDENGVIQAINGQTSSAMSNVISLASKVVGLAATVFLAQRPPSLEEDWARAHPGLSVRREELVRKVEDLLEVVADPETSPQDTALAGTALTTCQSQLATISEARRAWIASRASSAPDSTATWVLSPRQLLRLRDGLPESLTSPAVPEAQRAAADDFGVLLALSDPDRDKFETPPEAVHTDVLIIRVGRPVTIGVYTRSAEDQWVLDDSSVVHLDVVDEFSHYQPVSVNQRGGRSRSVKLSFYGDQSVKTFGIGSDSALGTVGPALGELVDASSSAYKSFAERPSAERVAQERAKTQLDLLKTASEYEVLSATREHAAELAALEQSRKLAELRD
ncbi:hypothetical protein SAMN04489867_2365 [Pedococcus dokdonensis]|uniref:Uncharacterized protein n=1 Tax=Pedococcus dokdonensis TaxID=443156 RepID=A0A1H0SHD2_9MICO|nr:hypothetical protein [Pedococcus dokdonensis]SDP41202.1 hypothetical protein SAMN04489867_2365 [Pedococcus dokdonensis]